MSSVVPQAREGTLEECVDELNDFVATLDVYSHTVLAMALSIHLTALLQTLLRQGECTAAELRRHLRELAQEVR
ncbi:MAG TPA: hypothetical protein VIY54_12530 [Steroidobacteraceae bacterium]